MVSNFLGTNAPDVANSWSIHVRGIAMRGEDKQPSVIATTVCIALENQLVEYYADICLAGTGNGEFLKEGPYATEPRAINTARQHIFLAYGNGIIRLYFSH